MKINSNISAIFLCALSLQMYAQNVGINKDVPKEALDVVGNINLTGSLLVNGEGGATQSILQSNGVGGMAWVSAGSLLGYKNSRFIINNSSFTVPAGVNQIMVELWSAGAGGAADAGGCSGSYGRYTKSVAPGNVIQVTIGTGGSGQSGATDPTGGGQSQITFADTEQFIVYGPSANIPGQWQGFPGVYYLSFGYIDYFQYGNVGEMLKPKIIPYFNNQFLEIIDSGKGGMPPGLNFGESILHSSQRKNVYNSSGTLLSATYYRPPVASNVYSASGGGVDLQNSGLQGANGLAIIWW